MNVVDAIAGEQARTVQTRGFFVAFGLEHIKKYDLNVGRTEEPFLWLQSIVGSDVAILPIS